MKKFRSVLALLLVAAMCLALLAACAKSNKTETPQDDQNEAPATPDEENTPPAEEGNTDEPEDNAPPADDEEEPDDEEEIVEIDFYILDMLGMDQVQEEKVIAAINDITEPEIGVHVNGTYLDTGSYGSTLTMAISGGEAIDLCCVWCVPPTTFSIMYSNGQLMDIEPYMAEYGQELQETVGVYLDAYRQNGGLYGVPCFRNYAASTYYIMRSDLLRELGVYDWAANEMDSFTEMEELLQQFQNAYPDMYAISEAKAGIIWQSSDSITWTGDDWSEYKRYDLLGDNLYWIAADADTGDAQVYSLWEDPDVVNLLKKHAEWYNNGWMWPDAANSDEHADSIVKQNISCSYVVPSEIGVETAKEQSTGYEVLCRNMGDAIVDTASVVKFGLGVPVTSDEPEATVKFLNLLYNSKELMNLIDWGIEGEDYQILDSGEAEYVNPDVISYHLQDFVLGNYFLVTPWHGDGADFRDRARAVLDAAPVSPYMGFAFDTSALSDTVAGLTQVYSEYAYGLLCRGYNETEYNEMVDKLYAAGLEGYIAAAQEQLDAFMANK